MSDTPTTLTDKEIAELGEQHVSLPRGKTHTSGQAVWCSCGRLYPCLSRRALDELTQLREALRASHGAICKLSRADPWTLLTHAEAEQRDAAFADTTPTDEETRRWIARAKELKVQESGDN
jgi:hypothetical protein